MRDCAGAAGVDFIGPGLVLLDFAVAPPDSTYSTGLELAGMVSAIWLWDEMAGRNHPMREPMRKLTAMMARMARVPRTRVQASYGEWRAGRGLDAMNSGAITAVSMLSAGLC